MAISLKTSLREMKAKNGKNVQFVIALHSGLVVSGIVGEIKP